MTFSQARGLIWIRLHAHDFKLTHYLELQALSLNDGDIEDISAYFASLGGS